MLKLKRHLILTGIVIFMLGCGGPPEKASVKKPKAKFDPYARLTETEVKQFIKGFPIFIEEAKKHGKAMEKWGGTKNIFGVAGAYSEYIGRYKEMEATIKAKTGIGIEELFSAYFKVMMAFSALSVQRGMPQYDEVIANIEKQLKTPGLSKERKELLAQQLKMAKETKANVDTLFQKVPPENIQVVQKYEDEIKSVMKKLE